mgnify:FL=1
MIHTNNRAIPNNMKRWYQPTIGNNIHPKGHDDEGTVDIDANIKRATIQGWKAVAEKDPYLQPKNEEPRMNSDKLHNTFDNDNYRVLTPYFSDEMKAKREIAGLPRDYKGDVIFKDMSKIAIDTPELTGGFPKTNSTFQI